MPNKWTFTIKPIKELLARTVNTAEDVWADPFSGKYSLAQYTNDINVSLGATSSKDALDWLKELNTAFFGGVFLDPPYSFRQFSECYKQSGRKATGWHTSPGYWSAVKNEIARIIKPGGIAICFGWNSNGLGKNRGFEMVEILLVAHGGSKNDTIVTVEKKLTPPPHS